MRLLSCLFLFAVSFTQAEEIVFKDDFKKGLADGWSWVREDPKAWRATDEGLELRILPGNLWGKSNNAKNVMVRPVPDFGKDHISITVSFDNTPTEQFEQINLSWYYDDKNMVKLGLEQVHKNLCVVMGREEKDKTKTVKIVKEATTKVDLRMVVHGNTIEGYYRLEGQKDWTLAGECTLPDAENPKISLHAYNGPGKVERWAKVSGLEVKKFKVTE